MTQRYLRPILWGLLATAALLTVMACGPLERLQQPREGQTPSQVPQELSVLWEVWQTLEEDFGGEQSIDQRSLSEGAIQGMVDALGDGDHAYITAEDYDLDAPDLGAVWQAWQAMWERLEVVDTKVTPEELQQAAIRGMLEALGNPYTTYLTPANYELEFQSFNSSFEGIGAYVGISNEQPYGCGPYPRSPG